VSGNSSSEQGKECRILVFFDDTRLGMSGVLDTLDLAVDCSCLRSPAAKMMTRQLNDEKGSADRSAQIKYKEILLHNILTVLETILPYLKRNPMRCL
jgi:hypothetical protein